MAARFPPRRKRFENRRPGFVGIGRGQPGGVDSAPRASDLCMAGDAGAAAFLVKPRSADAFVCSRAPRAYSRAWCSSGCPGVALRVSPRRSLVSQALPARRASTSFVRVRRGSAATPSANSFRRRLLLGPAFVQMFDATRAGRSSGCSVHWRRRATHHAVREVSLAFAIGDLRASVFRSIAQRPIASTVCDAACAPDRVRDCGPPGSFVGAADGWGLRHRACGRTAGKRYLFFVSVVPKNIAAAFTGTRRAA